MKSLCNLKSAHFFTMLFSLGLTACGGGGGSSKPDTTPASSASSIASSVSTSISSSTSSKILVSSSSSTAGVISSSSSSTSVSSSSASTSSLSSNSSSAQGTNALAALVRDQGGIFWYQAEAGDIQRGALIGTAPTTLEKYEDNEFVAKSLGSNEKVLVLSPTGWIPSKDNLKVTAFNNDGSVTTQDTAYDNIGGTLSIKESIDLSGLNILEFLQSPINTNGITSIVNPNAVFASGAKGYRLNTVAPLPIYNVSFEPGNDDGKCWGGDSLASASGGNCVNVNMRSGEAHTWESNVSGYSKLFSPDVAINTKDYRAVIMGSIGPNTLEIQIINDANKTVKFYENSSGIYNRLIATATWSEVTLPYLTTDNKAVHFTYPQSVFAAADVWSGEDNPESYIIQQNGYLRPAYTFNEESDDEDVLFNATANTSITNATVAYTNPLVGNWKLGDTDTFIFSDNNTFTHVKAFSDDPTDCYVGSATGTYSWNPLTSMVDIDLQADSTASEEAGSCSVEGKFKLALEGNEIVFFDEDDNEHPFTKVTSSTGLAGTWVGGDASDYAIWLFTDTQYFISDYNTEDGYGTESGTYTYNADTGKITATVVKDGNGGGGLSSTNGTPLPLVIAEDNNTFLIDNEFTVKRLK